MLDKTVLSDEMKNKDFLRSCDLVDHVEGENIIYREQVLTIKDISLEEITDMEKIKAAKTVEQQKHATKQAYVLHFAEKGYKPYVVSAKVVIKAIEKATETKVVNNWIGKKIKFYVQKGVQAFGMSTDALRVKPTPVVIEMAKCDCCGKEIQKYIYDKTKEKCGYGLCSTECLAKMKAEGKIK